MSVRVLSAVLTTSEAEGAARLVAIVLADAAHDDGVTWIPQREIAAKARLAEGYVRECVKRLVELGEVATTKVQRGRKRITVYRVLCAPEPVDVEKLPFAIDTASLDDRRNPAVPDSATTADPQDGRPQNDGAPRARDPRLNRKENRNEEASPPVPKLVRVGGRDLAYDALAKACSIRPSSPRTREIPAALNGSPRTHIVGIRELRAIELQAAGTAMSGEEFERDLAETIVERAGLYRQVFRDATLTPLALAKWWIDLPALAQRAAEGGRVGLTAEEIASGAWRDA